MPQHQGISNPLRWAKSQAIWALAGSVAAVLRPRRNYSATQHALSTPGYLSNASTVPGARHRARAGQAPAVLLDALHATP